MVSDLVNSVRCFFCNGELKKWPIHDDAWMEHARCFRRCQCVNKYKSVEFIKEASIPRNLVKNVLVTVVLVEIFLVTVVLVTVVAVNMFW